MDDKIRIKHLGPEDAQVLENVAPDTFDNAILPDQAKAFLTTDTHDIVVALDDDTVIGFASGLVTLHPDKAPAYFIAEVGVNAAYQRRGIATRLTEHLIAVANSRGIDAIWLATEADNTAARALYTSLGARETTGIVVYDWGGAMDD